MKLSRKAAFFVASRRRHTNYWRDWSSGVCSSELALGAALANCSQLSSLDLSDNSIGATGAEADRKSDV